MPHRPINLDLPMPRSLVVVVILLLMTGCSKMWVRAPAGDGPAAPTWSYSGEDGPSAWSERYPECGAPGQSPIDISSPSAAELPSLEFIYETVDGVAADTMRAVRVLPEGGTLTIGESLFTLREIVFRTPSEHAVDGETYDGEMQLIHANEDSALAVVSVLLMQGDENDFVDDVLEQLKGERLEVELEDLLPDDLSYFVYEGSMTTPPCSRGVTWYVLRQPLDVSSDQLSALQSYHNGNARPEQPRSNREIRSSR